MRVIFIHPNFPAQFRHVAAALGRDSGNEVAFVTANPRTEWEIPGVNKILYKTRTPANQDSDNQQKPFAEAVQNGQAVMQVLQKLKKQGFSPDLVCGHSGWGTTIPIKDVFPDVFFLGYFEWYYNSWGGDADCGTSQGKSDRERMARRCRNGPILIDLAACDHGLSPTQWQKSQFPKEFARKICVLHDGIDTDFFKPAPGNGLSIANLQLPDAREIVTYAARGMEPYRGFPQFMESLPLILEKRPGCHAVIVGSERVCYGQRLPDGKTYKQAMLEKLELDLNRVHFVGPLPYGEYKKVLQASSAHVYLTRPFVLSWSMLEAMACGCVVIGSNTPPVQEVIRDGENGFLTDFYSPKGIAERVIGVLEYPSFMAPIRKKARVTVVEKFSLKSLLPKQLTLIHRGVFGNKTPLFG